MLRMISGSHTLRASPRPVNARGHRTASPRIRKQQVNVGHWRAAAGEAQEAEWETWVVGNVERISK